MPNRPSVGSTTSCSTSGRGCFGCTPMAARLRFRSALAPWGSSAFWWIAAAEIVSQREIMHAVWPNVAVEPNNLTVQISALRRALDADRAQGSCIQNVPGRGYRFVPTVTETDRPLGYQAANTPAEVDLAPAGVAGAADAFDTLPGQPEPPSADMHLRCACTAGQGPGASLGPPLRASPSRFWRRPLSGIRVARRYPRAGRLPHTHRRP